jgi:hypothetical protein
MARAFSIRDGELRALAYIAAHPGCTHAEATAGLAKISSFLETGIAVATCGLCRKGYATRQQIDRTVDSTMHVCGGVCIPRSVCKQLFVFTATPLGLEVLAAYPKIAGLMAKAVA